MENVMALSKHVLITETSTPRTAPALGRKLRPLVSLFALSAAACDDMDELVHESEQDLELVERDEPELAGQGSDEPVLPGDSDDAAGISTVIAVTTDSSTSAYTVLDDHLVAAQEVVTELDSLGWDAIEDDYNRYNYATGGTVTWGTPGQPMTYDNNSQCAPFVTQSMKHAYPWAAGTGSGTFFYKWFAENSPTSTNWYQKLKYGKKVGTPDGSVSYVDVPHFETVATASSIEPGDILAIRYGAGTSSPTGHTAIIESSELWDTSDPARDTYRVRVYDSTSNPHGLAPAGDTRSLDFAEYAGAGAGFMLLYADKVTGAFTGYKWGENEGAGSEYENVETVTGHPFVVAHVTDSPIAERPAGGLTTRCP